MASQCFSNHNLESPLLQGTDAYVRMLRGHKTGGAGDADGVALFQIGGYDQFGHA